MPMRSYKVVAYKQGGFTFLIDTEEIERLERRQNAQNSNAYEMIKREYENYNPNHRRTKTETARAKKICEDFGGYWPVVKKMLEWKMSTKGLL